MTGLHAISERDVPFEGTTVHCFDGGTGRGIIFLHGSGAGAATLSNFRRVLGPLAADFHVLAADLVGFGRSGRRPQPPYFDMDLWVRELQLLLDIDGNGGVIVVGHSLSGPIALKAAAMDKRIAGVITTGTMGVASSPPAVGGPAASGPHWAFPEGRDAVRWAVERTFYDKALAEEAEIDRRLDVLGQPGYREYFEAMFEGPSSYYRDLAAVSDEELALVTCPVALMHGVADASFSPGETSLVLAGKLARADVHILAQCAHSVAHERPEDFLAVVRAMAERLAGTERATPLTTSTVVPQHPETRR